MAMTQFTTRCVRDGAIIAARIMARRLARLRCIVGVLSFAYIVCATASLSAAEALPAGIKSCRSESNDARRLRCYDREIDKMEAPANTTAPDSASTARDVGAPVPDSTVSVQGAAGSVRADPAKATETPAAQIASAVRPSPAKIPLFKAQIASMTFRPMGSSS